MDTETILVTDVYILKAVDRSKLPHSKLVNEVNVEVHYTI